MYSVPFPVDHCSGRSIKGVHFTPLVKNMSRMIFYYIQSSYLTLISSTNNVKEIVRHRSDRSHCLQTARETSSV